MLDMSECQNSPMSIINKLTKINRYISDKEFHINVDPREILAYIKMEENMKIIAFAPTLIEQVKL